MAVENLVEALQTLNADDALRARFNKQQWLTLVGFLQQHTLRSGDVLIRFRDMDRGMYFLESGTLQVYVPDSAPVRRPVAILRPGSVVGEPSLFGETPRMAQVEAMSPCTVWLLTGPRFEELSARQPSLGIEFLRAVGGVMAERMRANLERGLPVA
ncbi:MAG: calcium-binding protein [Burkholderiales bacterium PBB6]|uniref:Cyclic nucleotide-binding domain-containing protein n=1 Tax=Ideonella margarita TaxID=2984191 RepID=A0ABU9C478_9BURK|nr:MAG: calcium-binding protein [Burkholderiales bacterium PBB6]